MTPGGFRDEKSAAERADDLTSYLARELDTNLLLVSSA